MEVIINTEWLIITLRELRRRRSRQRQRGLGGRFPCAYRQRGLCHGAYLRDAAAALRFTGAWSALCGRPVGGSTGSSVLLTTTASIAVWVVWTVMYTYGNPTTAPRGRPSWPSPATQRLGLRPFYVIPGGLPGDQV